MKPDPIQQLQKEPTSLEELQTSYNQLYKGWMGQHKNLNQANRILDLLNVQPGGRLLDVGCGLGYTLDLATKRGLKAVGVDISQVALKQAQKENRWKPQVLIGEAECLPLPEHTFDYVIVLGSLEHFINPAQAVREISRLLKPNGKAALLVPNSHHIRAIYNVYKYGEILSDMQDFERFATRAEWERLFRSNNLHVESVHKCDTGMGRVYRKGRELFWYAYNSLFRIFGDRWIPINLTYTFIFICTPAGDNTG